MIDFGKWSLYFHKKTHNVYLLIVKHRVWYKPIRSSLLAMFLNVSVFLLIFMLTWFIQSHIHLLNICLSSGYYMPDTTLEPLDMMKTTIKTKVPVITKLSFPLREQ